MITFIIESRCGVSPGLDLNVPVRLLGGAGAHRIDHHDLGAFFP
jgi:hypothetical protein